MFGLCRPIGRPGFAVLALPTLVTLWPSTLLAEEPVIDLTHAVVLNAASPRGPARMAAPFLLEEVGKRTHAAWRVVASWPDRTTPVILVGTAAEVRDLAVNRGLPATVGSVGVGTEGYRIGVESGRDAPVVWVAGEDDRGVLFGVGRLLRALRIERTRVTLPADFAVQSAPRSRIRGMQLGYRPKTNSYDGWTVAMWEQYLRDMIVFGCNAVELIPPRSDDDEDSEHFPLPKLRMMVEMSRLADAYGLDVWIWYPALDQDYSDRRTVEFALKEWGEVFQALPRVDAVFVPGGDPGRTPPKVLLGLLEEQAANLKRFHPRGQMWMSPQSFTRVWMDEFLSLLRQEPAWLSGVVYGPQLRMDLPLFRSLIPARYPVRDYPDITHSRHCQYPVPDWDVAFALTEGREVCNPRPEAMARIFRRSQPHTVGAIGYSEGCHDDVNKMIWLALGWDERTDVREILRDYGRYFIGSPYADRFADGLLGLERNWVGPALFNDRIEPTLALFRELERETAPAARRNWRFQLALYRAYYDAYIQERLRFEAARMEVARVCLRSRPPGGTIAAMAAAEEVLNREIPRAMLPLRSRLFELAEALFQSIHMQLSVEKYQAVAIERGASLDAVDTPFEEAGWLKAQIAAARLLGDESERRASLDAALDRTNPGPGGFYDDLGDPNQQPHLVRGVGVAEDPAFYASSLVGFGFRGTGPRPAAPAAWWSHAESLYDAPLVMRYEGLDRSARYRVRVVYSQERAPGKIRLHADDRFTIHDELSRTFEPLEFSIPAEATADGKLTLSWTQPPGGGGTGRGCQVTEVWLLRDRKVP